MLYKENNKIANHYLQYSALNNFEMCLEYLRQSFRKQETNLFAV